jgi:hypothetical protein
MNDVLERLAAADPAAGGISPEDQREADTLLARIVATPPEVAHARRRGQRRVAMAAGGLACAAVVAFAAIALVGSDGPSTAGAVDKAVAATTRPNTIYHVLERARLTGISADRRAAYYYESWYTTNGRFHLKGFAPRGGRPGRLDHEYAGKRRPGRNGGPALVYEPRRNEIYPSTVGFKFPERLPTLDPFAGPGLQLRQLRQEGRLRASGTTELDGRSAIRLVSELVRGFGETKVRFEYLVDARSHLPLRQLQTIHLNTGKRAEIVIRYLTYERRPLNSRTKSLLALDDHPGAKCVGSLKRITGRPDAGFPHRCTPE